MNIKDEQVYQATKRLAELRGTTLTGAVRSAVEEALEQELARQERQFSSLKQLQEEIQRAGIVPKTPEELYDERGLPQW